METLTIQRFRARYRLPARATAQRRRLDRVLGTVLEELLESAVERAGVPPDEQICIRKLFAPVRVRLSLADNEIAEAWSRALAEAIRGAALGGTSGRSSAVAAVRYRSRIEAMLELAAGAAFGDLSRAWAWRQLGLWQAGERASQSEAIRELVRALVREPTLIIPLLRAAAERGLLRPLAFHLEHKHWLALASAALTAARATVDWHDLRDAARPQPATFPAESLRLAWLLIASSRLAQSFAESNLALAPRLPFAALVFLEADPALAERRRDDVLVILAAVQERMSSGRPLPKNDNRLLANTFSKTAEPLGAPRIARPQAETLMPAAEETSHGDLRSRVFTRHGGMLFLLNLLEHLAIPAEITATFPNRLSRWVLHQLALLLAPVSPDDPAALAFTGIASDSPPPSDDEEPPSPAEGGLLGALAEGIVDELAVRLNPIDVPREGLLEFVCARRAEIVADPGWIEARFSLEDVSTELRRAGLDLDPGYLPWLGVVMKFAYE